MSGRLWEQRRIVRYYLHRWPSQAAMARVRAKVRDLTGRNRVGRHPRSDRGIESDPARLGNYFRTGNAADKFTQIDRYVTWRLKRLLITKRGRNLRAGQADQWTTAWFRSTAYTSSPAPSVTRRLRNHVQKIIGKPCAGKPHARIERGMGKRNCFADTAPLTTNGCPRRRPPTGRRAADHPARRAHRQRRVPSGAARPDADVGLRGDP